MKARGIRTQVIWADFWYVRRRGLEHVKDAIRNHQEPSGTIRNRRSGALVQADVGPSL